MIQTDMVRDGMFLQDIGMLCSSKHRAIYDDIYSHQIPHHQFVSDTIPGSDSMEDYQTSKSSWPDEEQGTWARDDVSTDIGHK
jgi:hypothetical protein